MMQRVTKSVGSAITGKKRLIKKILYIVAGIICLGWVAYIAGRTWSANTASTAATNHAYLADTSSQLQNLTPPRQLQIGVSSGNADVVALHYRSLATSIKRHPIINGSYPAHGTAVGKLSKLHSASAQTLTRTATDLEQTATTIDTIKKFLQYDPVADLTPIVSGQETDASERANRTADGITAVANALARQNAPTTQKLAAVLEPLPAQARAITASSASDWYSTVAASQQNIVDLLDQDFTKHSARSQKDIKQLYQQYLLLK